MRSNSVAVTKIGMILPLSLASISNSRGLPWFSTYDNSATIFAEKLASRVRTSPSSPFSILKMPSSVLS